MIRGLIANVMKAFGIVPRDGENEKCSAEILLDIKTESTGFFMITPREREAEPWPPKLR